jgi:glycosyltransferase involved in cell wall biosynthesis
VDDKSTDGCLEILREYKKKDIRVKVIELERNSGISVARNTALRAVSGEYVGFVDSDDYVDLDFFEKLYNAAIVAGADIAKAEAYEIYCDGEKHRCGPKATKIRKNKVYFTYVWWTAIYKHDLIEKHKIDFDESILICQDSIFLTKAVNFANKVECVGNTYYNYIRRADSEDSKMLSAEKIRSNIEGYNKIIDFINQNVDDIEIYNILFKIWFGSLLYFMPFRTNIFDARIFCIRSAIESWNKCKFKEEYKRCANKQHVKWLEDGNETAFIKDLVMSESRIIKDDWRLFNVTLVGMIINRVNGITDMRLFNFIPLLKIKKEPYGISFWLFFLFPVFLHKKT